MTLRNLYFSAFCCSIFLFGCGGGGSDSSAPTPTPTTPTPPTSMQIIQDPVGNSSDELKAAYSEQITSDYRGMQQDVTIDLSNVQQIYSFISGEDNVEFFQFLPQDFENLEDGANLNETVQCDFGGLVTVSGTYNASQVSTLEISYEDCDLDPWSESSLDGKMAMKILVLEDNNVEFEVFYQNVTLRADQESARILGYSVHQSNRNAEQESQTTEQNILITNMNGDEQFIEKSSSSYTHTFSNNGTAGYSYTYAGELFISDIGHVEFTFEDSWLQDTSGQITATVTTEIIGENKVKLEVEDNDYMLMLVDNDNVGGYELGAYLGRRYQWQFNDLSFIQLIAVDLISLPPEVYSPYIYQNSITTLDEIVAEPGYYYDPDTDESELTVSYRWYVNDVLVEGQTSNVFPARIAVFGDTVKVSMVVSDTANTIESFPASVTLDDAQPIIVVDNLPNNARSGDTAQFSVYITDPDLPDDQLGTPLMVGAPEGASMDEDGLITWQTSNTTTLLPLQNYQFTFATDSNSSRDTYQRVSVPLTSESPSPIARSGVEVPTSNYSMWVGDFHGNGLNSVLSTDSNQRVFLISEDEAYYHQSWMYPYALPTDGRIKQVIGVNIDSTDKLEIIVLTESGVSIIDDLNTPAKTLYRTDRSIQFGAVADANGDGVVELALLMSSQSYNAADELKVINIDSQASELFSTDIDEAYELIFANVDEDAALELVINNGLVYDAQTWANEWYSGTGFGSSLVTAVDFNGDGIASIVGADVWGYISIYSAVEKAQLASFDNFNTCSLNTGDVDANGTQELLVGDCQWGNITAYTFAQNDFSELWHINMQEHGSKSVLLGDADNDGDTELLWTSGQSSSGEDVFLVADITAASAELVTTSRSVQLGRFSAAGWSDDHAVFFVPSTNSGYDGSVVVQLDAEGKTSISETVSSNWDSSHHSVVADIYNDGFDDIIAPTTDYYDGSLAVIQLDSMTEQWRVDHGSNESIGVIQVFDVNQDEFDDILYTSSRTLRILDPVNELLIASQTFSSHINDFTMVKEGEHVFVAVSTNERLHLLRFTGTALSETDFVDQSCNRLEFINIDNDTASELVCLTSTGYRGLGEFIHYELASAEITEAQRFTNLKPVADFIVNTTKQNTQSLFILERESDDYGYCDSPCRHQLTEINSEGLAIWSSDVVLGSPLHRGIKFRQHSEKGQQLLISTDAAMHWLNP